MSQSSKLKSKTQNTRDKARNDYFSGKTSIMDYLKLIINNPPRYTQLSKSHIQVKKQKQGYLISVENMDSPK